MANIVNENNKKHSEITIYERNGYLYMETPTPKFKYDMYLGNNYTDYPVILMTKSPHNPATISGTTASCATMTFAQTDLPKNFTITNNNGVNEIDYDSVEAGYPLFKTSNGYWRLKKHPTATKFPYGSTSTWSSLYDQTIYCLQHVSTGYYLSATNSVSVVTTGATSNNNTIWALIKLTDGGKDVLGLVPGYWTDAPTTHVLSASNSGTTLSIQNPSSTTYRPVYIATAKEI